MEGRVPQKRRRIVMACRECYRRKQKCNRGRPCNVCIARNVPDVCSYTEGYDESLTSKGRITAGPVPHKIDAQYCPVDDQRSQSLELREQAGYLSLQDGNAFNRLQKSLQVESFGQNSQSRSSLSPSAKAKVQICIQQLPPYAITNELVKIYFTNVNESLFILEEHYFNDLYHHWLLLTKNLTDFSIGDLECQSRDRQYFPAQLFLVLAITLQYLPPNTTSAKLLGLDDRATCDTVSEEWNASGTDIMATLGRCNPAITAIQNDLLRSLWFKNCSRGTEAWQAQGLGLHLQCTVRQAPEDDIGETLTRVWYDEYKRRLWVVLFMWDSHMSLILGRPRTINASDCTIRAPIDCDIPDDPSKTVPATTVENEKPSSYSSQLFGYSLSHKMHEMMSLGANKRNFKDYGMVRLLHDQAISLLDTLPPVLRPENPDTSWDTRMPSLVTKRENIVCKLAAFLMVLHRPHIVEHAESREAAIKAAIDGLESQQRIFERAGKHLHKNYTLSFYTIDAGIFLSAIIIEHPELDQALLQKVYHVLQQAISRILILSQQNSLAKSGLKVLSICFQKINQIRQPQVEDVSTEEIIDQHPRVLNMQLMEPKDNSFEVPTNAEPRTSVDSSLAENFDWGQESMVQFGWSASSALFAGSDTSFWTDQMNNNIGDLNFDTNLPIDEQSWDSLL